MDDVWGEESRSMLDLKLQIKMIRECDLNSLRGNFADHNQNRERKRGERHLGDTKLTQAKSP